MEALSDLNTFAKILTDKGYNGYFHTQGAYAGKLKDSISEYLESCQKGADNSPKQDLLLTGYLQWSGDDKPRVECSMWVKYLNGKFSLSRMEIAKKDGFGQLLKKSELTNLSVISAPKLTEAVALVNDEPKQKRVKLLSVSSYNKQINSKAMKKLRANMDRYFDKLDEHWRALSLCKQHQYTLYFFVGYLLLTVAVIGKVMYDTSKSGNDMVIEHIENPVLKNGTPARLQDSVSTILKNQSYERK